MLASKTIPLLLLLSLGAVSTMAAGQASAPEIEMWGVPSQVSPRDTFEVHVLVNNTGSQPIENLEVALVFVEFVGEHEIDALAPGESVVCDFTAEVPTFTFDGFWIVRATVSGEKGNQSFLTFEDEDVEVNSILNTTTCCTACCFVLLSPFFIVFGYRKWRLNQRIRALSVEHAAATGHPEEGEAWLKVQRRRMEKGGCPQCGKKVKIDTGLYCRYKGSLRGVRCLVGPFHTDACHDAHYAQHPPEPKVLER